MPAVPGTSARRPVWSEPDLESWGLHRLVFRRRLPFLVLACALVAATTLRVVGVAEKHSLTGDESISYLAAACHQGDYTRLAIAQQPPFGRWVTAAEWKALLRPDRAMCLGEIRHELARTDIHPPLYFWLLHGWALVFGVGLWTGPSLNIAIAGLTTLVLFGFARRVIGQPLLAAGVAATWSFSPAAIRVFAEARQYELLALIAVLFLWQCVRFCAPPTDTPSRDGLLLAATVAAGALTQILFALVAVTGLGLFVVRLWGADRRLLASGLASLAAGYASFALLHPGFVASLRRGREQAVASATDRLGRRTERSIDTIAEFLLPPKLADGALAYLVAAMFVGAAAWLAVWALRTRGRPLRRCPTLIPVISFLWLLAAHMVLYVSFLAPRHAMSFKYLSVIWPFAAFVPVLALSVLPRLARRVVTPLLGVALIVCGSIAALGLFPNPRPQRAIEHAPHLVVDNVARRVLPRIVWRVPDRTLVFAADQSYLLAHQQDWLARLGPGAVISSYPRIVSYPPSGNTPHGQRRLLKVVMLRKGLIRRGQHLWSIPADVDG